MATRVQSSPFRETEWDQKLDRMLDDLKSTVHTDDEDRRTPLAVRSSSRSSSRAGSTGRRAGSIGAGDSGVSDHGRLTHHRKEYTSPDQSVRTVADTYQYDSGDAHPSSNFQKKVVKSTYSSYNVDGGLSAELESLKRGPTDMEMERALSQESRNILNANYNISTDGTPYTPNNKVVDASQDVARELVGALSCIGRDGHPLSNGHPDDDVVINDEKGGEVRRIVWRNRYEKTYETADSSGPTVSIEKDARSRRYNTSSNKSDNNEATTITSLTRPHVPPQRTSLSQSPKQLTLQYAVYWPGGPNISPGGQSWAEPVPLPTPPQVSPKEPGVAYIYNYGGSGGSAVQPLPPLNYVSVAPPAGGVIDGGAPSPTPSAATTSGQPVIYHYSYHYTIQPGQTLPEGAHPPSSPPALQIVPPPATGYSTSANLSTSSVNNKSSRITEVHSNTSNRDVHHHHTATKTIIDRSRDREPLDPNYPSDDGGKPRYPDDGGKPRYPEDGGKPRYPDDGGKPRYPDDGGKPRYPNDGSKPPGPGSVNYTSINSSSYRNETHHHPFPTMPNEKSPRDPDHPPPSTTTITYDSRDHDGHPHPPHHHTPNDPNRNIMININKTTTHTTHTTSNRDGSDGQYPPNDNQSPLTSTPYRGRSRSPERRYPAEPRYPSGPSDSLERVRRPHQHGLPFPETSPVKGHDDNRIPRKVDELMTDFPVKNGGPHRAGYPGHPDSEPLLSGSNQSRQNRSTELHLLPAERNEINTVSPSRMREERDKTKNQSGPPVYYPPGHEEFSESMHTMTLKEGGRRGKAKWRKEAASGYQESSSHSESKGGVKMVPVCLPLCCGAACTIM